MNPMTVTVYFWGGTTQTIELGIASGLDVTTPNFYKYMIMEIEYNFIDLKDVRMIQTQHNLFAT